jgi:hypothetical protein
MTKSCPEGAGFSVIQGDTHAKGSVFCNIETPGADVARIWLIA